MAQQTCRTCILVTLVCSRARTIEAFWQGVCNLSVWRYKLRCMAGCVLGFARPALYAFCHGSFLGMHVVWWPAWAARS